jgi:hypothetical protein
VSKTKGSSTPWHAWPSQNGSPGPGQVQRLSMSAPHVSTTCQHHMSAPHVSTTCQHHMSAPFVSTSQHYISAQCVSTNFASSVWLAEPSTPEARGVSPL